MSLCLRLIIFFRITGVKFARFAAYYVDDADIKICAQQLIHLLIIIVKYEYIILDWKFIAVCVSHSTAYDHIVKLTKK